MNPVTREPNLAGLGLPLEEGSPTLILIRLFNSSTSRRSDFTVVNTGFLFIVAV